MSTSSSRTVKVGDEDAIALQELRRASKDEEGIYVLEDDGEEDDMEWERPR